GNYSLIQPTTIANIGKAPAPTPSSPSHATYENESVFNNVNSEIKSMTIIPDARYEQMQIRISEYIKALERALNIHSAESMKIVTDGERLYIGY
ncbi:MAG: hypothetical protein Q7S30_05100, partial [Candidatus Omnitrophota bacterium]|nr:hypothetical protein [Candidatus Omnitrophota bacterium]